jgi:hypothetical protein
MPAARGRRLVHRRYRARPRHHVTAADGNLGDYLRTLGQLRTRPGGLALPLPGHGAMLADPLGTLDYYLSHRAERLDQVRSALAAGAKTLAEIVAMIYTDVDPSVWPAAEWSVRAQLDYLDDLYRARLRRAYQAALTGRVCAGARRPG